MGFDIHLPMCQSAPRSRLLIYAPVACEAGFLVADLTAQIGEEDSSKCEFSPSAPFEHGRSLSFRCQRRIYGAWQLGEL